MALNLTSILHRYPSIQGRRRSDILNKAPNPASILPRYPSIQGRRRRDLLNIAPNPASILEIMRTTFTVIGRARYSPEF